VKRTRKLIAKDGAPSGGEQGGEKKDQ